MSGMERFQKIHIATSARKENHFPREMNTQRYQEQRTKKKGRGSSHDGVLQVSAASHAIPKVDLETFALLKERKNKKKREREKKRRRPLPGAQ